MLETKTRTETGQWKSWHHFIVFSQCMFCSRAWRCLYHVEWKINNHSLRPSPDVIHLTLTLKMTTAQVVETSLTVNNNSPIQDCVHPNDHTQPAHEMTPGGSNLGHTGGRQVFSPLHQPCSPNLAHMAIPALSVSYMDLRDMIGSFGCLRALWLATKITYVLHVIHKRSI